MLLLTCLLTYLLGNRNSRDGWNVPDLVTVQQCSIISGYIVLFLTLVLTTYLPTYSVTETVLFLTLKAYLTKSEGAPYKCCYLLAYLLTYLLGNRNSRDGWNVRCVGCNKAITLLDITLQNALGGVRSVDKAINGFTDDDSGRRCA